MNPSARHKLKQLQVDSRKKAKHIRRALQYFQENVLSTPCVQLLNDAIATQ